MVAILAMIMLADITLRCLAFFLASLPWTPGVA